MPQQSLPPKESCACLARMSFKKGDEYCLIQELLVLKVMKVASTTDSRIPAVALILMHMSDARNKSQSICTRAYFAIVHESSPDECPTCLSDLKKKERLDACLKLAMSEVHDIFLESLEPVRLGKVKDCKVLR